MSVHQELPEGTVTVMFIHLASSIALGDRLGDDRAQAPRRAPGTHPQMRLMKSQGR